MALNDEFEMVRASILLRSPLPFLDSAAFELMTKLQTLHSFILSKSDLVAATFHQYISKIFTQSNMVARNALVVKVLYKKIFFL